MAIAKQHPFFEKKEQGIQQLVQRANTVCLSQNVYEELVESVLINPLLMSYFQYMPKTYPLIYFRVLHSRNGPSSTLIGFSHTVVPPASLRALIIVPISIDGGPFLECIAL